jgi:hypothetical protein
VAATTAAGATVVALALVTVGPKPFVDFVQYQLPRIESGEAFFWIEDPVMAPVNQSIYGLVTKLRGLGLPGTGVPTANAASTIYALLLVPLAIVGVRRLQHLTDRAESGPLTRLRHAQLWLGLLSLASFRSPFVPDAYGLVGTLWLLTLIAVERQRLTEWAALVLAGAAFSLVFDGGLVPSPVPLWLVLATVGIQLSAYGINLFVVLFPDRRFASELQPTGRLPAPAVS